MGGCCDRFYRCLERPEDTPDDKKLRRLLLPVAAFVAFLSSVAASLSTPGTYTLGLLIMFVGCGVCVIYILLRIRGSYRSLTARLSLPVAFGILTIDLANASTLRVQMWPTVVILMDYLVAIRSSRQLQTSVMGLTLVYFTVMNVEATMKFGAHEVGKLGSEASAVCGCPDPPCAVPPLSAGLAWGVSTLVYIVDFYITRGFATGLYQQMELAEITVSMAEKVAGLLANYAIAEARVVVEEDGEKLSDPLRAAFGKLLDNLERYRAFLPPGLLAEAAAGCRVAAPSTADERAQVAPQLAVPLMRRAVQVVWSQAARHCRAKAEQTVTELLEMCISAGDVIGAQRLLQVGWTAPSSLRDKVRMLAADDPDSCTSPAPGTPTAQVQRPRVSSVITGSTRTSEPLDTAGRFGDGADDPATSLVAALLWPVEYVPPSPVHAVRGMAEWHEPTGKRHWPSDATEQIMEDYCTLYSAVDPGKKHMPLYVYTVEICLSTTWAVWRGARWNGCTNQDTGMDIVARTVQLEPAVLQDLGIPLGHSCVAELLFESPHGLRVYGVDGEPRVLRYENTRRGDPEASPLNDAVLWAPRPEYLTDPGNMFSILSPQGTPVPPGVLEFITSRDSATSHRGRRWESIPLKLFSTLHERCMAQKNQQRPKEALCRMASGAFNSPSHELGGFAVPAEQLADVLPVVYQAKCPSSAPTPAQIAHACELGLLQWEQCHAVVAFTGGPRIAVPLTDRSPSAVQLWRISKEYWPAQPYYLMNLAMRSQQLGDRDARLTVSGHALPFYASQPAEPPSEPEAALFRSAAGTAQWLGAHWGVTLADGLVTVEPHGELQFQGWGMPQYRALIWHINDILSCMPTSTTRVKGYRGLLGVTLDRRVYSRGKVIMFPAFTSTSHDQGVAAGFAQGEGAAVVFTTFTATGRLISAWSRFGREKEVLLRPNTLHLVTDALSAEHAAIVDKETLQVFDLKEVTPAEATRYLAKEGALSISGEHPSMLQQAARAAALAEQGDWEACLLELLATPAPAAAEGGEGHFVRSVLPKSSVGIAVLVLGSPGGCEIGAGVDQGLWNRFFERAEAKAKDFGATLVVTHLGHIMMESTNPDGPEATAQASVGLALELMGAAEEDSPRGSQTPAGRARRKTGRFEHDGVSREKSVQVHCGVTVGTVHGGFGGSAQRRVEIADGPAVRRAFRMAAYSLRHNIGEVITDAGAAGAAAVAHTTWTVDLVSFDSQRDLREPITCVERREQPGAMGADTACLIEAAWDAVEAAADGSIAAVSKVQERVARLPQAAAAHRAARALQDAVAHPSTYCYDLEGTF